LSNIFSNCSSVALNIFCREPNSCSSFFAVVGPVPGKPSSMNCFCCWGVSLDLVCLIDVSGFCFSYRLAVRIRKVAVSSWSLVYMIGIWKSFAIERSIPRIAFWWMLKLL